MILSVAIITHNEEANIGRALASVQTLVADGKGEIIVVDSGSRVWMQMRRWGQTSLPNLLATKRSVSPIQRTSFAIWNTPEDAQGCRTHRRPFCTHRLK